MVTASPGITAYCAVEHHPCGRVEAPDENKTILVTSAAGAVGLNVFIDNVGADQLDAGARHMEIGGRIMSVGAIGEMDALVSGNLHGFKEYLRVPAKELTFGGFLMYDHVRQIPAAAAAAALLGLPAEGKLRSEETVVHGGFGDWADCVDKLYESQVFGRMILALDSNGPAGNSDQ